MLKIIVPLAETFDEDSSRFVIADGFELELEHSLLSVSKWEEEFEKPFLGKDEKTVEQTAFYIEHCMTLTKNPPGEIWGKLSKANFEAIQNYINGNRTATWFNEPPEKRPLNLRAAIITSEVIYGWMVGLKIPFETQTWYLNRLFTLIKVCNEQTKPPKKMGRAEAARQQAAVNAKRLAEMKTRG